MLDSTALEVLDLSSMTVHRTELFSNLPMATIQANAYSSHISTRRRACTPDAQGSDGAHRSDDLPDQPIENQFSLLPLLSDILVPYWVLESFASCRIRRLRIISRWGIIRTGLTFSPFFRFPAIWYIPCLSTLTVLDGSAHIFERCRLGCKPSVSM